MKSGNLKLIFLSVLTVVFVGCSASKKTVSEDGSSNQGSRSTPNTDGSNTDADSKIEYFALCNDFSGTNLTGVVTNYLNPVTNQYVWDHIRMELAEAPDQLKEKDSFYIQFFKWQEETAGSPYTNPAAVGIYFQYEDGTWLNDKLISTLSKNTIEQLINDNNLTDVTVDNFLDKVILVLSGIEIEYDALMINTYDAEVGTTALTTTNVLLPAFAADPNLYAETHAATSLQMLHPNYDIRGGGYTQWQYFQETQALCNK
ncbi:MAG: hypothetical protein KDD58_12875 [Bdellovibrionales bacterium]|nr:hypothetical protein [Bdellovibrionales bacterium]